MATTTITLSRPQDLNLPALADATKISLQLLKSLASILQKERTNAIITEFTSHLANYVDAVRLGVAAAYSGHRVTEEIIFLADALPVNDKNELERYVLGTAKMVHEAQDKANRANAALMNVNIEAFKQQLQDLSFTSSSYDSKFQETVEALLILSNHMSAFANWWDWMKVESGPTHPHMVTKFKLRLDSLKSKSDVKRWKDLRLQYMAYVQMIMDMEDSDPELFKDSYLTESSESPVGNRGGVLPDLHLSIPAEVGCPVESTLRKRVLDMLLSFTQDFQTENSDADLGDWCMVGVDGKGIASIVEAHTSLSSHFHAHWMSIVTFFHLRRLLKKKEYSSSIAEGLRAVLPISFIPIVFEPTITSPSGLRLH